MFLNPHLLHYFTKGNFLFDWSRNLRCLKNRTLFTRGRSWTHPNSEGGAICNNSLRLKAVYSSLVTSSSNLNVGRGPRPAFHCNGVS